MPVEMRVEQLRDLLSAGTMPTVLDVREPHETQLAPFAGAVEIPMGEVPARLDDLRRDEQIVVLCHHGVRSARVASFLEHEGFKHVANLTGGIDAWSLSVDPSVPRY